MKIIAGMSAEDMRSPSTHTCAVVRSCTHRATTFAPLGHGVVVWSCDEHAEDVKS